MYSFQTPRIENYSFRSLNFRSLKHKTIELSYQSVGRYTLCISLSRFYANQHEISPKGKTPTLSSYSIQQFSFFTGLTEPFALCNAGFVCYLGASTPAPTDNSTGYECLPGYYCPEGSVQGTKCPLGTFSASYGLENVTECTQCTTGKHCETEGNR